MKALTTLAAIFVFVWTLSACSPAPAPSPSPVAWGDRVPVAASDVVAAQPVVARGPDSITLLPISPTGAAVGPEYGYDMPHCGILSAIDVDGSFWDAVDVAPDSTDFDGQAGSFRLISSTQAVFTTTGGEDLRLERHVGAKEFRLCS